MNHEDKKKLDTKRIVSLTTFQESSGTSIIFHSYSLWNFLTVMTPSELPEYKWSPSKAKAVTSPSCLWLASLIKSIFATILFASVCISLSLFFSLKIHTQKPERRKNKNSRHFVSHFGVRCLKFQLKLIGGVSNHLAFILFCRGVYLPCPQLQ